MSKQIDIDPKDVRRVPVYHPGVMAAGLVMGLVLFAIVFFTRESVTDKALLVGSAGMTGAIVGGFFALLTKNIH